MSNPDFSQSPQHVALAEAMVNAVRSARGLTPCKLGELASMDREYYLIEADAAITHLGSGYVLPEATERNAERLAQLLWEKTTESGWDPLRPDYKQQRVRLAMNNIRAMHAAFGEKPEPVFLSPQQADEMEDAARIAADHTYCRKGCEKPFAHPGQHSDEDARTYGEEPTRDAYADGERRRERQRLVWEAKIAFAGNNACVSNPQGCLSDAVRYADTYLAWRDADEANAKERFTCKK